MDSSRPPSTPLSPVAPTDLSGSTEKPPTSPANLRTWKNGFRQAIHGAGLATAIAVSIKAGHLLKASISNQYGWILMGLGVALATFSLISYARLANYRATGNSAVALNSTEMWKQMGKDLGWAFFGAISGIALNVVTANALFFEAAKEGANAWQFLDPRNALQFMNEAGGSLALAEEATMLATGIGLGIGLAGVAMTAGGPLYLLGSQLKAAAGAIKGRLPVEGVQATDEPSAPLTPQQERWLEAAFTLTRDENDNVTKFTPKRYLDRTQILNWQETGAIEYLSSHKEYLDNPDARVKEEVECMKLLNRGSASLSQEEKTKLAQNLSSRAKALQESVSEKELIDNDKRNFQHGFSNCIIDIERYLENFEEDEALRANLDALKVAQPVPAILNLHKFLQGCELSFGQSIGDRLARSLIEDLKLASKYNSLGENSQIKRDLTNVSELKIVTRDSSGNEIKTDQLSTIGAGKGSWLERLKTILDGYSIPIYALAPIGNPVPLETEGTLWIAGTPWQHDEVGFPDDDNNPILTQHSTYKATISPIANPDKVTKAERDARKSYAHVEIDIDLNSDNLPQKITIVRHDYVLTSGFLTSSYHYLTKTATQPYYIHRTTTADIDLQPTDQETVVKLASYDQKFELNNHEALQLGTAAVKWIAPKTEVDPIA